MITKRRTRRLSRRHVLLLGALLGALAVVATAGGTLAPSTFDAFDGNLIADPASEKDWENVGIVCETAGCAVDEPTGASDDSFTGPQANKEDSVPISIGTGSIPNNKSDLTRFYVFNERVGTGASAKQFLYLAWERVQEPNGSTNMDFEFNQLSCGGTPQSPTPNVGGCSGNGVTPTRTANDLLIKYDLARGGTSVTLSYHKWIDTGACELNGSTAPCWGPVQSLTGTFEGSFNAGVVTDPIAPNAPRDLSARTFGEASINLSDSNIFPTGQCRSFGSAFLKSRSSAEFSADLKDFIAPLPVNISNCGSVVIRKQTIGGTDTFQYTSSPALPSPANASGGFSLTTTAAGAGGIDSKTFNNIAAGTQRVTEDVSTPAGWELTNIECSGGTVVIGAAGGFTAGDTYVDITVSPDATVTCTFTNTKKGKIVVDKVTNPTGDATSFSYTPAGTGYTTGFSLTDAATPNDSGLLSPGSYSVEEAVPAGWDLTALSCSGGDNTYTGASSGATNAFEAGDNKANIDLDAGETVTCTFTNTKRGSIKIVKDAVPNDAQDFSYSRNFGASGSFVLDDDSNATLSNTETVSNLAANNSTAYTVSETTVTGWSLSNIVCVDDGGGALDSTVIYGAAGGFTAGDTGVSITLAPGETVRCDFTNTSEHKVIVIVCHTGTGGTLTATPVQELPSGTPKNSIGSVPGGALTTKGVTQADLCAIGGAAWDGLGHGNLDLRAQVGNSGH